MTKVVLPSLKETAFCCPICGAYTSQKWHTVYAKEEKDLPSIYTSSELRDIVTRLEEDDDSDKELTAWFRKSIRWAERGLPLPADINSSPYINLRLGNVHASVCFNCNGVSLWVGARLVHPITNFEVSANPDMPEAARSDFDEAAGIVSKSPRSAAALLRQCIEKICREVTKDDGRLDDLIGQLVAKGMSPLIQKALDSVRVIGNHAVHPGTIDLRDDRETAMSLFRLVNTITDYLISHPKHVDEIFSILPDGAKVAIEKRDREKTPGK